MMTEKPVETLSYKRIFLFWFPLAATWLMMAVENPLLTAIISRSVEAKFNLAAFGVAFSFGLIIEGPVIMLLSASTALVTDRDAFLKLRRFAFLLIMGMTCLLLILLLPPVFNFITRELIGLPDRVASLTHGATCLLLPWPGAIGYRRFYQGILIRTNLTRRVAYGTVVRVCSMAGMAALLYGLKVNGAYVGTASLSFGVVAEAIASRIMVADQVKQLLANPDKPQIENNNQHNNDSKPLTYGFIFRFYYPLAAMSVLSLGVHPFVTFFIGKSRLALESLAVLPVINALLFIFRSIGLSYTEAAVTLLGKDNRDYIQVRNFAGYMGVITSGLLFIISFTPLIELWYREVAGLSPELAIFAIWPTRLMAILPGLTVLIAFQWALIMNTRDTAPISRATMMEVGIIIVVMLIFTRVFNIAGALASGTAYTLGRIGANIYLYPRQSRETRKWR